MTNFLQNGLHPLRVSVVIPAYNEEKNIGACLRALGSQTKKPYEIIVANNNSVDKTVSIGHEYGARIILAREQGYVFALQEGMANTSGDIVAVVDADTVVATNWVEMITQVFSDSDVVGVTGSVRIRNTGLFSKLSEVLFNSFLFINFKIHKPHLVGFNFAVRKTAFTQINGLNTVYKMGPDVELGLRLKEVGRVVYEPKMIVYPSMRRYEENPIRAFIEYTRSYLYTVWLRKPAQVRQKVIR